MKTVLKRALCGITAFVVAAGAMSYFPADTFAGIVCGVTAYAENETWRITITADDSTIRGDGSKDSPYEITTAEQLFAVMKKSETKYAVLKDDIVINDGLLNRIDKETGEPLNKSDSIVCWTPISDDVFCKTNLDGGNYKISGLYINESGKAGLYASLKEGSFKNLTITDSFVKGGNNVGVLSGDGLYNSSLSADNVKIEKTIVRGESYVGGLFGSHEPDGYEIKYTITNCTVGPDVTVTGTGDRVGGIASECRGTILYSSSGATVTGKNFVGGVVGYAGGGVARIWYCHNDGAVKGETSVGGVLGYGDGGNENPIRYIYNTGDVSGDNDVAGLVGTAKISPKYSYNIGNVAYNDGSIAPQLMNYSSYFAGKRCLFYLENTLPFSRSGQKEQTTTFKPNESNQTAFTFTMDQVASGELAWRLNLKSDKSEENGYANCWVQNLGSDKCPTFGDARYAVYPSETGYHNHDSAKIDCDDCRGVAWDPYYPVSRNYNGTPQYEITNYHELLGLAKLVNDENKTITASLMNDIVFNENLLDASGNVQVADPIKWTPIGNTPIGTERFYFNGIFNGNGHTISGLYVDSGDYAGLFGKAQGAPQIKGVGIVDSYFKADKYVGGIVGAYYGNNGIEYDFVAGCFTYNVKLEGTNSTTKIDQFVGDISGNGKGKLNNNYCLADKEQTLPGISCSAMTADDFASGKVAYLMNKYFTDNDNGNGNVWGQVVANSESVPVDPLPTAYREIGNDGSNEVINFAEQYHNHLGSATCTICGTVNPQEPAKDNNGVYQIGTPSELLWFADYVNKVNGNPDAVLTADINMNGIDWTPIGTKDKAFQGEFDGRGHVITNLTVNDSSLEYAGLFGYVSRFSNPAIIKNLGVVGKFSGGKYVGGIAGYLEESKISNCFFIGTVSGKNTNGIANGATIENCYFQSDSTDINARTEKQFKSGEVAELLNTLPDGGTQDVWGQTIGGDEYPRVRTSNNKVIRDFTSLGWHNHTGGTTEDDCPKCVKTPKQENGVYQISTIQELFWFSSYVNNTDNSIKAVLVNDITVNTDIKTSQDRIIWTPVGTSSKPFTGTFDGKGHIIRGLVKENSTEPVGLFGVIGSGAKVSNVGVVNFIFSNTDVAGGIAGSNKGTITDSYIYDISLGNSTPIVASDNGKTDNCYVLKKTDNFAEIAYNLNRSSQTWGFKIGDDKLPTAINEANRVYLGKTYHNHDENTLYCKDCCDFILTKPNEDNGWYLISKPGELAWFARLINGGIDAEDHTKAKAKLTADLDFSAYTDFNWTPIGTADKPFSGTFDGNSYTISGLKSSGADHAGLFGYADGAAISKLIVKGCYFSGKESAAAMCGSVGTNGVTFDFCGSYGNTLTGISTAGFVGASAGEVTLERCYTADSDKFSDGKNSAFVSYVISSNAADDAMTEAQFKSGELTYVLNKGLDTAVWFQTINTQDYPQFSSETVYRTSPCVSYTNDSAKTNKPHDIGDDGTCKVCGERGIPKKNSKDQYELSNELNMLWFAKSVNSGEDISAVLMNDIDMKDAEWTPIGTKNTPFSGKLDGKGHTISGLNYSGGYAGMFGYMNGGTICNIRIAGSSFKNGTVSGGICAVSNGGTIENCAVDNVDVSGGTAGGICGQNSGTITDCFFSGNVSSDGKSGGICGSNSGTIESTVSLYAGAAVGENTNGSITNCLYNIDIAERQKFGSGLETTELTDPSILTKLGNSWCKAANTTKVLFYPELTDFKTGKYNVRVNYRLTLENTDKSPVYKDTLHFTFDVQSAPENSKKWNSVVANLVYNDVRQQDFELSLDGIKLEFDAAPAVGNRLDLMLDGENIGVLYMDKTLKVRIEITYPLKAGKHIISVKYVGSSFDYLAGKSAECAFTISKVIVTDPEASVEYGKALKDAELTKGWEWTDSSVVPNSKNRKFKAFMIVDDENYDLSGVKGLNGNKITQEVEVSFKKAVPVVTVTTDPFSALPGTKITVSVSAVNPNNAKFSDVPAAELFYTAGGTKTAITGGSFVIPDGLEEETVITVTAKTEENEFYKAGNGSAEVIVSAHQWSREWKIDKDGHWRECTDCGISSEKSAHVSGGAATETTAEKCTVCGYVITPAFKAVEAPVITPDGGSFTGSQIVTITCATDGAVIHYTIDGTEPTASSTKYSGGFTITATTTIKAVAFVGEAKSSVSSASFTRKAQSDGSGGSVRPTRPDTEPRPSIDGKSMSWAEISVELAKRQDGGTVKIMLNGAYEVPADVIRVIAGKKLHIEFVVDSLKSWLTDGAKISAVTAADLSVIPGGADRSALRGMSGADLRVSGTKIPADLKLSFRKEFAGQFANVYKLADGKLIFHGCAKLGADGTATIPGADSAGEYVVMVCEFSDMSGDINNDGVLNALDASAVLKSVIGISQGANPLMGDFNKDGTVNAIDASDILKWIIRS